ncbi:hypothetical protein [Paenibacillus sp. OV219]|uniref:hypothetical protein n=1 Tax=Paenibacillus sp. OV219 TaxID=1884377 RepID=UPI0008B080D8|nr:hypothetical protein [Paenibacillus sp. OV219]SEM67751.1 hypothetical protein SAMN05518847_101498 [Paenibacillus sp. OV219]
MLVLFIIALAGAGVFYVLTPSAAKQEVVIHGSTEKEHVQKLHEGAAFTKSQM